MAEIQELETQVRNLEAQVAQILDVSMRHGDAHTDEGSDPMLDLNRLRTVATTTLLPATQEAPTIYYVTGPPIQLFLIDSNGQREMGYSEEQRLTGGDFTLAAGLVSVPGCTITLPAAESYLIIANFQVEVSVNNAMVFVARLSVGGVLEDGTISNILPATSLGERRQLTRVWRVTTTAANVVALLQAAGNVNGKLLALSGSVGDTSIIASSFLGGGQTAATHQHAHSDLTSVGTSDHHTKYTDAEARTAVPSRIYQPF